MLILKKPKVLHWTYHARGKMRFYGLSEQRVKRVLNSPKRLEKGIAPKTIAVMQAAGSKNHPHEIWAMVRTKRRGTGDERQEITMVISAWRYPGVTKPGEPLPAEILKEIKSAL